MKNAIAFLAGLAIGLIVGFYFAAVVLPQLVMM